MGAYEKVTEKIIEEMEKGIIPWQRPWIGVTGVARSGNTGNPYSLLNQLLVGEPGYYYTYNQAVKLGGKPKAKTGKCIYALSKRKPRKGETEEEFKARMKGKSLMCGTTWYVFSESNCELEIHDKLPKCELVVNESAEDIIRRYIERAGLNMEFVKQPQSYYSPSRDTVVLPVRAQFKSESGFYSTWFHELVHSTGHESRLNRLDKDSKFGNEVYSKEELVAELGSAMLMNILGIENDSSVQNTTAYLQSWISALQNDKTMIVKAAKAAENAVNMILGKENAE